MCPASARVAHVPEGRLDRCLISIARGWKTSGFPMMARLHLNWIVTKYDDARLLGNMVNEEDYSAAHFSASYCSKRARLPSRMASACMFRSSLAPRADEELWSCQVCAIMRWSGDLHLNPSISSQPLALEQKVMPASSTCILGPSSIPAPAGSFWLHFVAICDARQSRDSPKTQQHLQVDLHLKAVLTSGGGSKGSYPAISTRWWAYNP